MCPLYSRRIVEEAFAKTSWSQALIMHQQQSGTKVRKETKETLQSSCISDLSSKLSTQAVTGAGLAPQINYKWVFAKRSLALLLRERFVKSHKKMSLLHRKLPLQTRRLQNNLQTPPLSASERTRPGVHGYVLCVGMAFWQSSAPSHLHTPKISMFFCS